MGGGSVNGKRADVRNIFDLQSENDYEDDEYNRPINPTGLFSAGGFGQITFFKQNLAMMSQMEDINDQGKQGSNFIRGSGAPTNEYDDGDSDHDSNVSDDSDQEDIDPLETFLSVLNLTEYYPLFKKERMDL